MGKTTVSLAIIAKDEFKALEDIIGWYGHFFQEVHIAIDTDVPPGFLYKDNIYWHKYEWCNDFAHKRNFLTDKIKTDYYVRMDTDDELVGLDNLQWMLQQCENTGTDIVLCNYRYYNDESGNTELAHNRETIIKNDKKLYWAGRIHESVVCDNADNVAFYTDKDGKLEVVHKTDSDHKAKSVMRNLAILEDEYEKNGAETDPRYIAYLARSYGELGRHTEAIKLLCLHIEKSGWDEDRYISYLYLANSYIATDNKDTAIDSLLYAIKERPDFSMAYGQLCEIYFKDEQWKLAIDYGQICISKGQPQTNMGYDPSLVTWKIPLYLSVCHHQLNNIPEAVKQFAVAKAIAPNSPDVVRLSPLFIQTATHYDYMASFLKTLSMTKKLGGSVENLILAIPQELRGHAMIEDLRHHYLPSKKWAKDSVVIWCGKTDHMWDSRSIATGIGGSEEAAIWLSRELTNLGYTVTIFNNCETEYNDNGVVYKPYVMFNRNDHYANLISWRQNIAMYKVVADNHIIWIHDLPREEMLEPQRIVDVNKIIVLSEYHKSLLPEHVRNSDKVVISTNGLVPDDYLGLDVTKREPKRIIYASSYDRGLMHVATNWHLIRKAEPEAELHIYYGWNTYDDYVKLGYTTSEFKDKLVKLFEQDGIHEHGRLGHKELLREYCKANVFAYPCNYSGEINCIALSKAIATGCNIITNDFAVLAERSPNTSSDVLFIDELIETLKQPPKEIDTDYINSMSWASVATQWSKEILNDL